MSLPVRLAVLEHNPLLLELFCTACRRVFKQSAITTLTDGTGVAALIRRIRPHVLVLGLPFPGIAGFHLIGMVQTMAFRTHILALAEHCTPYLAYCAAKARLRGLFETSGGLAGFEAALAEVADGRAVLPNCVGDYNLARERDPKSFHRILSDAEIDVLELVGDSRDNDQIAAMLGLSKSTVRVHLGAIRKKLDLRDSAETRRYAAKMGFSRFMLPGGGPL